MTIFQIIQNAIYMAEGYLTWGWNIISGKTRKKAKERLTICNQCDHNKHGICDICGCILKAKVRVNFPEDQNGITIDGCPLKKW